MVGSNTSLIAIMVSASATAEFSIMKEEELHEPTPSAREVDRIMQIRQTRIKALQDSGYSWLEASAITDLERRITAWPKEWGDDLCILIYGDFVAPEAPVSVPEIGIIVETENLKGTVIRSATCVLRARVKVAEKSVAALADAAERIDTLLGVVCGAEWGNVACGWWSHVTHGSIAGPTIRFETENIRKIVAGLQQLKPEVRRKVKAALYWIREPRQMLMEGYRSDALRVYAGYWNAFECLVDAVSLVNPHTRLSKPDRQTRIEQFIADRGGKLTIAEVGELYRAFVDPGFASKASHALRVCFPEHAAYYVQECFHVKPKENSLYAIRNAINHGDVDAGNFQEVMRIEAKHQRLWMIVFRMLGLFIPVARPLDSDVVAAPVPTGAPLTSS